MAVDEELLAAARAAQGRVVEYERAVDLARAEFRYGVRKLHLAGASLREIGDALNLSHQRVHQIVEEAEGGVRGWRSAVSRGDRPKRPEVLACSFCGTAQKEARKLIAGPGYVAICDVCTAKALRVLAGGGPAATPLSAIKPVPPPAEADGPEAEAVIRCSFCGKARHQVAGLAMAAGTAKAGVTVCDECLALCQEIITED